MFEIIMIVDGTEYVYGRYEDRKRANEIAMEVRDERRVDVYVRRVDK